MGFLFSPLIPQLVSAADVLRHSVLVTILQIKKLKFGEVGELVQARKKGTGRDWYHARLAPKPILIVFQSQA